MLLRQTCIAKEVFSPRSLSERMNDLNKNNCRIVRFSPERIYPRLCLNYNATASRHKLTEIYLESTTEWCNRQILRPFTRPVRACSINVLSQQISALLTHHTLQLGTPPEIMNFVVLICSVAAFLVQYKLKR